jgi:hypothetical protein
MKIFISILVVLLFVISCRHDGNEVVAPEPTIDFRAPDDPPLIEGEPILGDELENPYDIANMQDAYELITGVSAIL